MFQQEDEDLDDQDDQTICRQQQEILFSSTRDAEKDISCATV